MKILGIETSCDDTGIAILEIRNSKFEIRSNIVSSQTIHQNYGGVFPMMAKREHQRNLLPVLENALQESKLLIQKAKIKIKNDNSKFKILEKIFEKEGELFEKTVEFLETHEKPDIDYIAVTHGPGLEPCLWVGVNFAKALSYAWDIPIIPANHIEAHILVNFIDLNSKFKNQNEKSQFKIQNLLPAIALVVSGGHTQLILMKGIGEYEIIGETRDDAAGECFDKAARILELGYPGGPIISSIAAKQKTSSFELPRPMMNSQDYDFSFSGLKTAVLYKVRDEKMTDEFKNEMCVAVQDAIVGVLIKKTLQSAKDFGAKTIILGGGVSANAELRKQFSEKLEAGSLELELLVPPKELSTDNGLMIAVAGYFNRAKKIAWQKLSVNANLRIGR